MTTNSSHEPGRNAPKLGSSLANGVLIAHAGYHIATFSLCTCSPLILVGVVGGALYYLATRPDNSSSPQVNRLPEPT